MNWLSCWVRNWTTWRPVLIRPSQTICYLIYSIFSRVEREANGEEMRIHGGWRGHRDKEANERNWGHTTADKLTEEMKCHSPPVHGLSSALLTWKCQAVSFAHKGVFKLTTNEVLSSIQRLFGSHLAKHCFHIIIIVLASESCIMEKRSCQVTLTKWPF